MGDVNKLGAYANKADWIWTVIQDSVKQKQSNSTLKIAFNSAQQDVSVGKNLMKYVS
jgi:predicted DNA-binding protein (MmcQ/YjbR family)